MVPLAERRAPARHVFVDGGAPELHDAAIQAKPPSLDPDGAQADTSAGHLLNPRSVAQREPGVVEARRIGRPQLGGRNAHGNAYSPLGREPERPVVEPAVRSS